MKYEGQEIGLEPTLTQIECYVCEKGFTCEAIDIYNHYKAMNWCTRKGTPLYSLEAMCDAYNGVYLYRLMKKQKHEELKAGRKKRKGTVTQKIKAIEAENNAKKPYTEYSDQLNDTRWKYFRNFVFAVRGKECEMCGSTKFLQVHHLSYISGRKAWEYTCNDVIVVCGKCHKKIHNIK